MPADLIDLPYMRAWLPSPDGSTIATASARISARAAIDEGNLSELSASVR
jgi:hypothetical protein